MNNFTSYTEALKVAKETKLSAYDFHPYSLVHIIHEEGTVLTYRHAFTKEWKDYVFVFTEHHGIQVHHKTDLSYWGTFFYREDENLTGTGYMDKCEFCNKEFKVEDLIYSHHPDVEEFEENKYWIYCKACKDIVGSEYEQLWVKLNNEQSWRFVWGLDDLEHIKKACATVMLENYVEKWLDTASDAFPNTPRQAIDKGDYEEVYLAIYKMGSGQFS